ncbi:DDE-type integrase/transposase/recombinase [Roseomonas marmotae]|uniref:DDE-type integrase/transposase/recombinase n=1 Tax=Roseomonas marmotae TaxID=2768161 RepID=A0ABS3K8C4_9PROT|nr:DDE-type integrase/transposase/recombinase [Roseomonas marmotae]QTI80980.1 DDE-type integrase/transposase/recombinase [Roseomonas marmotae]
MAHLKDDETARSAIAFLREAAKAFPFRLTHELTDNGSCFTPVFAKVCAEPGAAYRHTRRLDAYVQPPQTNGMVERFNGAWWRVQRTGGQRGAGHRHLVPCPARAAAPRLQRRLQRPPPARPRRQDARPGCQGTPPGATKARPPQTRNT